ncbi:MAG: hypothetical protein RL017_386 [Pseudomonadota bacterium]|jgi:5-aminolevulinate synthase
MINYDGFFQNCISSIKIENRYRVFQDIDRYFNSFPRAYRNINNSKQEITIWCSLDYLGMATHPVITGAIKNSLDKFGAGSGGSRNIAGNHNQHLLVERELANLHKKEAGLLFTSGYNANQASIMALGKIMPNCVFLSDEDNHASIISGIKHSGCQKIVFKHNDYKDLKRHLEKLPLMQPKVIIFESLYSMSGSIAPIKQFIKLAKQYNAMTYVDEVHAVGIYGQSGGGITEQLGIASEIDIIQGTLGKAFGVVGGYITGNKNIVDAIRSTAGGFIFTVSLPPAFCDGICESIQYIKSHPQEGQLLFKNANTLRHRLQSIGINIMGSNNYIIPIFIGDAELCTQIGSHLLDYYGIYTQAINYPSVRKGQERLRVTITAKHTEDDITKFVDAIDETMQKFLAKKCA